MEIGLVFMRGKCMYISQAVRAAYHCLRGHAVMFRVDVTDRYVTSPEPVAFVSQCEWHAPDEISYPHAAFRMNGVWTRWP